jgi:hypothetical protein
MHEGFPTWEAYLRRKNTEQAFGQRLSSRTWESDSSGISHSGSRHGMQVDSFEATEEFNRVLISETRIAVSRNENSGARNHRPCNA